MIYGHRRMTGARTILWNLKPILFRYMHLLENLELLNIILNGGKNRNCLGVQNNNATVV